MYLNTSPRILALSRRAAFNVAQHRHPNPKDEAQRQELIRASLFIASQWVPAPRKVGAFTAPLFPLAPTIGPEAKRALVARAFSYSDLGIEELTAQFWCFRKSQLSKLPAHFSKDTEVPAPITVMSVALDPVIDAAKIGQAPAEAPLPFEGQIVTTQAHDEKDLVWLAPAFVFGKTKDGLSFIHDYYAPVSEIAKGPRHPRLPEDGLLTTPPVPASLKP